MTDRKLRISHVEIRAVLVWDDGEELAPGPDLRPAAMPLSQTGAFLGALPSEVATLAEKLASQDDEPG